MAIRQPRRSGFEPERSPYDGQRMSLEEFEALDLDGIKPYLEWWDGLVIQKAVPKWNHNRAQSFFDFQFYQYKHALGGEAGPEPHVWFIGRGYRVPDLALWVPGRPWLDDHERQLPPTLAVEIISTGQSVRSQREKCRLMRANGVAVCWLIDPDRRAAEVFEDGRDGEKLPHDGVLESVHVPGLRILLADLWAELDRPVA